MGLVSLLAFCGAFLAVGLYAGRYAASKSTGQLLLADRRLPLWLGTFTLVSTWVGGGYIMGTAEAVYDEQRGLVWTQAPWCFACSLIIGGLCFARPMRRLRLTTMLDLFDKRYGPKVAAGFYLPALAGELCWSAAILAALGTAVSAVFDLDPTSAILVSALVAMLYTSVGGLWSVALTDALQLACIVIGLGLAIPFALSQVGGLDLVISEYFHARGETAMLFPSQSMLASGAGVQWVDTALLLILGGIPWQVYFQRVLACESDSAAVNLSVLAGIGCLVLAVPAGLIGMIGSVADWTGVAGGQPAPAMVLPWVLRHLTPPLIALFGLCAISAAVMSSVDSSILSASSMFAWNVFRPWRPQADERRVRIAMRLAMLAFTSAGAILALRVGSIYTLWFLSADLVYVILFPQLVSALFDRRSNVAGAVSGAAVGSLLRLAAGEAALGVPQLIAFPEAVPTRTFAMLVSLATIWCVSRTTGARE